MSKLILLFILVLCSRNVNAKDFINLTGIKGKDISKLFDGDLTKNFNVNNTNEPLAFPFESWVVLDSIMQVTSFSYYVGNSGQTSGFIVRFLDINLNQVGIVSTPTAGMYKNWRGITVIAPNVRYLQIESSDPAVIWDGINEFSLSGINIAKAPSIYPIGYNFIPKDYGKFAHGINILGDRVNKILPTKDTALEKVAKAVRFYWAGQDFDYYPDHFINPSANLIWLGRYGFNHSGNLTNNLTRRGFHVMMNKSGGGINHLDSSTARQNTKYLGGTVAQDYKYNSPATFYGNIVQLYGKSKGRVNAIGGDTTTGQGSIHIFEWDNEPNRWWKSNYYHTPKQYYHTLRAVYDSVKRRDPGALLYAGALPGIDTSYWKAVYFVHYLQSSFSPFPADGFNFNMYLNDGSQQQEGNVGVSPELYKVHEILIKIHAFFNRVFGKPVQWTEFGYAVDPASPYDAPNRTEQANWTLRLKAIVQSVPFIERMYYYAFFEDGTPPFHTMGAFRDSSDWKTVIPYPVAYGLSQELYVERNSPWFSEVIKNGGDTGLWITKKGNLLKLWHPTKTVQYQLNSPSKVYKQSYNKWLPDSTITQLVDIGQGMTWIEQSEPPIPPTPSECNCKTIKAIIKTEYRDSATNKLIRTATATIYLR